VRELLFTALRGPQADVLRALVEQQGQFSRVAASINHLHAHYTEPLNVETLASCANMSASSFHEHFKRSTLLSPVQYLKRLRLLKAQTLLVVKAWAWRRWRIGWGIRVRRSSVASTSATSSAARAKTRGC
jgi:transcriptional regulator GlxA family with amidase domain